MLADISMALAEMRLSITQVNTKKKSDGDVIINIAVSCKNVSHLHSIVSRLRSISGVLDVKRGYSK